MSYARIASILVLIAVAVYPLQAGEKNAPPSQKTPKGAKVFIAPIADGFETYLKDAMGKKNVPIEVAAKSPVKTKSSSK